MGAFFITEKLPYLTVASLKEMGWLQGTTVSYDVSFVHFIFTSFATHRLCGKNEASGLYGKCPGRELT